jgi:hypothetical protein
MPNPHSFYRFKQAWNAGFFPDNVVISNLLNELATYLDTWIPANAIGMTFNELKADVQTIVDGYNTPTRLGGFTISSQVIPDSPNYEFNIFIANVDLSTIDSSQVITINGFYNPTNKIVVSAAVLTFTPGSYSGTFDPALIPTEEEVSRALQIVEQTGSAFFPQTYLFNPSTNIAKSGLARGQDWTLTSGGESTRVVPISNPLTNARTFSMPLLTAEEKFIISFLDRIIATSLADDNPVSIEATYLSMPAPDGWTKTWTYSSSTYDRIEIGFEGSDGRSFAMVGRLDGDWLWQRFVVNDATVAGIPDFLGTYADTTPLPYATDGAAFYVYFSEWFDLEFVEFNAGCYVSPEFYAMPAIPGDNWQFNVVNANIEGIQEVNVGLFSESGRFIQKIGEATKLSALCEGYELQQHQASVLIPSLKGCYRLGIYSKPDADCSFEFTYSISGIDYGNYIIDVQDIGGSVIPNISFIISGLSSPTYYLMPVTDTTVASDIVTWVNSNIPGMNAESDDESITFSWQVDNLPCGETYFIQNCQSDGSSCIDLLWESESQECICQTQFYLYSLSNIINIDASDCFSTMLEFWGNNDSIAQGFEYVGDWKQRVRLGINGGGAKPIIEENLYRQSNGVHKRPQNKQDLSVDLHTDFLDEAAQLALVDATRHPSLVWDGKSIFVKGDIEVATIQDFTTQSSFETLSQVKFQALIQGFQPKNSSCLTC